MCIVRVVPNIVAADPASGNDFYVDVLGLVVAMDLGRIVTFASPTNPNAQLSLLAPDEVLPRPDYAIEVGDVDACHARAVARGLSIHYGLTTVTWGVRRFFVRDPNGKIANVMSHV
jgi:catechol 2,3-dioxygenase-like lactoylglutathione lyase family enzyme